MVGSMKLDRESTPLILIDSRLHYLELWRGWSKDWGERRGQGEEDNRKYSFALSCFPSDVLSVARYMDQISR